MARKFDFKLTSDPAESSFCSNLKEIVDVVSMTDSISRGEVHELGEAPCTGVREHVKIDRRRCWLVRYQAHRAMYRAPKSFVGKHVHQGLDLRLVDVIVAKVKLSDPGDNLPLTIRHILFLVEHYLGSNLILVGI